MGSHNRESLLPYLRNLCALHLAQEEIRREIAAWEQEKQQLNQQNLPQPPEKPEYQKLDDGRYLKKCLLWALAALVAVGSILFRAGQAGGASWGTIVLVGGLSSALAAIWFSALKKGRQIAGVNEALEQEYRRQMLEYERQRQKAAASIRAEWDYAEQCIREWEGEHTSVQQRLIAAYEAAGIPASFRGLYPAVYLYDWCRSGQPGDLEQAMQRYEPEAEKARLDGLIRQLAEGEGLSAHFLSDKY